MYLEALSYPVVVLVELFTLRPLGPSVGFPTMLGQKMSIQVDKISTQGEKTAIQVAKKGDLVGLPLTFSVHYVSR